MANITTAISALQAALPANSITLPSSPSYTSHTVLPWSQTCHSSPSAFIHLTSPSSLSTTLLILKKHDVKFAVRTTGHNPNEGFSSIDASGVVLDLSGLNGIEVLGEGMVKVGAGCRWGDVYGFVEGRGRCVVGGRDPGVGVGGFLLGGGLGAFPNLYGLGTDNITAVELVTADGSITQASPSQNTSLFHVIKGGGSNFGIVTSFTLITHPPLHITYTISLFSPTDYTALNKATLSVQSAMEQDPRIGCFTNFNQAFVAMGLLYVEDKRDVEEHGSTIENVEAFRAFDGLEKMMAVAEGQTGTLGDLAKAMGQAHAPEVKKRYVGTVTTKPDEGLYKEIYDYWQDLLETLPEGAVLHYTIQPVGAQAVKYGLEQGGNVMGLEAVPQVWWVFTAEWPSTASDFTVKSAVDNLVAKTTAVAKTKGMFLDYLCANFASGKQDVLRSFGSESLGRMKEVAREWDGEGVFQGLLNGGFLLRDVK